MQKNKYELKGNCLVVHLEREIDHHYADRLREDTDRIISKNFVKNIVFDFEGVNFMDSAGIGMIMGRYKKILHNGGQVLVSGVQKSVDRILRMSGLYQIVERCDNVEDGIKQIEYR